MARMAKVSRKTLETAIAIALNLDGQGEAKVLTGIGFLDHILESLAKHASINLKIKAVGDLHVDQHHLVEDLGIALGEAVAQALKDKRGIMRAGSDGAFAFPMDEALALAAIDFANRTKLVFKVKFREKKVGELETNVIEDFFDGFANGARANVYLETKNSRSTHHQVEALFKAFARALREAVAVDKRNLKRVPSTKGKI
ncbi:MAG: imidazoleglycerol-phosphate dehydratase HisB [Candidatus Peribacteraceae bacterium]|nr:imidazoleglycerol-phosphate dehydratase HisB [Candidatus Peribacteraceae bacterium]